MRYLIPWLLNTLAILLTSYILRPSVKVDGLLTAFLVAITLGIINTLIKPLLIILTLPINLLTLGLFTFIINGIIILLVARIIPGFAVNGLLTAIIFSIVLSIVNWVINLFVR